METVQEYEIIIRLTKKNGRYGAVAETVSGELLESVPPLSATGNDALYALLHALALKNNFSGCLKEAQRRESVKNIEAKIEENRRGRNECARKIPETPSTISGCLSHPKEPPCSTHSNTNPP